MLRVKQENKSDQRPEGMISGYDVIEYTVGMTFYCTNNCTTSLKLNSIKGHYDRCGLEGQALIDKKKDDNKIYLKNKDKKLKNQQSLDEAILKKQRIMNESDSDSEIFNQEPPDDKSLKENGEIEHEEIENNSPSVGSFPTLNADFQNLQCKKVGDLKVPCYEDKLKFYQNKYTQKKTQCKLLKEELEKSKKKKTPNTISTSGTESLSCMTPMTSDTEACMGLLLMHNDFKITGKSF